jgi:phage gpG-like protein
MTPEQGIAQLQKQFKSVWLRVPILVGNEAVNFTLDNFRLQGFMGATFQSWRPRKVSWKKDKRTGRNLLIDSGRLRRSIRIVSLTTDYVSIGTDVKYAKAHNEGVNALGVIQTVKGFKRNRTYIDEVSAPGARKARYETTIIGQMQVKSHTRRIVMRIPKRQFMGDSPYLQQRLRRVVSYAFMKEIPSLKL